MNSNKGCIERFSKKVQGKTEYRKSCINSSSVFGGGMGAHEGHLHVSVMSINEHVLYSHKSPSSKFADIYSSMQNLSCANSDLRGPTS